MSQILSDGSWADESTALGLQPPLPPLTDPKHPKRKNGGLALPGEDPEEEEAALAAAAAGNVAEGSGNGEATAVGGDEDPAADDGSVEVGAGEETGDTGDSESGTEVDGGDNGGEDSGNSEEDAGSGEDTGEEGQSGGEGEDATPVG